jgi:excisionase family DNA binding protein
VSYHTPDEVAALFKVSRRVVTRHANTGEWPHTRVGLVMRFSDEDVAAIRAICERPARTAATPPQPSPSEWGTRTRGRAS